ncbi:MAG TPA: hypothetical protein VJU87_13255, partial [Gemmatimonadaceae bacterium]|nr:hypothetical protein [Gemmatimonadaceae bacterium]
MIPPTPTHVPTPTPTPVAGAKRQRARAPSASGDSGALLRTLWVAGAVLLLLGLFPLANLMSGGREVPWWSRAVLEWLVRGALVLALAAALAAALGDGLERAARRAREL